MSLAATAITAGISAGNPALGMAAELLRHRSPKDGNFLPNLGKSTQFSQVIPAVMAQRVSNTPRTDFGKAILSATGGNPRAVNQAVDGIRAKAVEKISHFDRRQSMSSRFADALKEFPHQKSLISY